MPSPIPQIHTESGDSHRPEKQRMADEGFPDRDHCSVVPQNHESQSPAPHWYELLAAPGIALSAALLCAAPLINHSNLKTLSLPTSSPPVLSQRVRQSPEIAFAAKLGHISQTSLLTELRRRGYTAYAIRPNGVQILYSNPSA